MRRVSRRAFVVVLDACGVGALPDAAQYTGDEGSNTLGAPRRGRRRPGPAGPRAAGARLDRRPARACRRPRSPSSTGACTRWGPARSRPPATGSSWASCRPRRCRPTRTASRPTWWRRSSASPACASAPTTRPAGPRSSSSGASTTSQTGEVILYTSADSVLQLAAHHDVLSEDDLIAACAAARATMTGEHAVGRVIARPFEGVARRLPPHRGAQGLRGGAARALLPRRAAERRRARPCRRQGARPVRRRGHRRVPPGRHQRARHRGHRRAGAATSTRGSCSPTSWRPTRSTATATTSRASTARCSEIDAAVGEWLGLLRDDDLLVLTADHGVDPRAPHTDHTREYAPLLAALRRPGRAPPRRPDGRRRRLGAAVAGGPRGCRSCRDLVKLYVSARAARGRDDPPPPRAPRRGARRWSALEVARRALVPAAGARELIATRSQGRRVERLGRRGKYLVWELEDDVFLLMHLRMTGHAAARPAAGARRTRACASTSTTATSCVFDDPRRFGTGELALGRDGARRVLRRPARRRAARAPTSRASTCYALARDRARADQGVPARPAARRRRRATSTPTRRCSARASIRCGRRTGSRARSARRCATRSSTSLEAGLEAKGATIDDFRDPDGVSGSFQDRFLDPPARGRAVPALRRPGAQAARRRARDLRLRALPAAPAGRDARLRPPRGELAPGGPRGRRATSS